ncbi:hypothetical protein [Leptolyngbya sp. KIOST-1]|uniref:hypothetical protein n=1 Tax=Leptolyngbya sp. KIOST-1 TaxID=1229172 RepID=UPI00055BA47A|nr:hypothetical protein [Leptolyngbya sp. KIOST-1]
MSSEATNLADPTPDVVNTLIGGLSAYGRLYGLPHSPEQMQGLLGTLLRLYRPEQPASLVDAVAQQVLDGLTPAALTNAIVDRTSSALAKEANRWQRHLSDQVQGVLTAYVQRYAPTLTSDTLTGVVKTVIPLLGEGAMTRSEVLGLVSLVVQTFDLDQVRRGAIPKELAAVLNASSWALAQTLATALSQRPMAEAVGETVTAYVERYAPALTTIGADLIATALSAVLKNQVDFDLNTQLTVADDQLLIEQVSFQLNVLRQSPPPSKAAWAIAAQVNTAVEQYRSTHGANLDVTAGLLSGDGLSISSPLTSRRRPVPPLATDSPTGG